MSLRVMFYVQHLLGIGHLQRAATIARAMAADGLDVSVVLGGVDVPGIRFDGCARVLLPSARAADATFKTLLDENDQPVDDAWRDRRLARLITEFESLRPHVLLIEQFPFGRRAFRFELLPLLRSARSASPRPLILGSVRDVLVRRDDPARNKEIIGVARTWFDRILVHGDDALLSLDASFPETAEIRDRLIYTGYVVAEDGAAAVPGGEDGHGEVIVSAGGGVVGEPLFRAAMAARSLSRAADRPWRFVTGPNLPDTAYNALAWQPAPGVIVERWRPDLAQLYYNADLSISQAGYNTIMEILKAGVRAVVVPFALESETEQNLRARTLADRGAFVVVEPATLSPKVLAEAVDVALRMQNQTPAVDTGGAARTAAIIRELAAARDGDIPR